MGDDHGSVARDGILDQRDGRDAEAARLNDDRTQDVLDEGP